MTAQRHDEIVQMIENLIRSGQLRAGERLPAERQLAESFRVSRNTVREAIKAMTEKGVVVSRRGAGTFVAEGALACMIDGAARKKQRLREIFELRKILEPQIASLAARRATADHLAGLAELVERQRLAIQNGLGHVELDETFHALIATATGNSVLADVYTTLHNVLAESRMQELQSKDRNRRSLAHHEQIVQALRDKSPERAADAMRRHMEQVEKNLRQSDIAASD